MDWVRGANILGVISMAEAAHHAEEATAQDVGMHGMSRGVGAHDLFRHQRHLVRSSASLVNPPRCGRLTRLLAFSPGGIAMALLWFFETLMESKSVLS